LNFAFENHLQFFSDLPKISERNEVKYILKMYCLRISKKRFYKLELRAFFFLKGKAEFQKDFIINFYQSTVGILIYDQLLNAILLSRNTWKNYMKKIKLKNLLNVIVST